MWLPTKKISRPEGGRVDRASEYELSRELSGEVRGSGNRENEYLGLSMSKWAVDDGDGGLAELPSEGESNDLKSKDNGFCKREKRSKVNNGPWSISPSDKRRQQTPALGLLVCSYLV